MKFMVKTQSINALFQYEYFNQDGCNIFNGEEGTLAQYETEERATEVFKELELWVRTQIANLNYYNVISQIEYSLLKKQAIFTFPKE